MSVNRDIIEALKGITDTGEEIYSILATVAAVNDDNTCDCIPVKDGPELLNVKLMPNDADGNPVKGYLITPAVDSIVIVTMTSKEDGFISMYSEIDSIAILGDKFGGLIKIEELVTKLNNLENKVNTIISTFTAHTHPYVNVVTPAVTSVTATPVVGTLTPTVKIDLENDLIKHGDGE